MLILQKLIYFRKRKNFRSDQSHRKMTYGDSNFFKINFFTKNESVRKRIVLGRFFFNIPQCRVRFSSSPVYTFFCAFNALTCFH